MQNTLHHTGIDFNYTVHEVDRDISYFVKNEKTLDFIRDFYVGFQIIPTVILQLLIKAVLSIFIVVFAYIVLYPVSIFLERKTRKIYKQLKSSIPTIATTDLIRLKAIFEKPEFASKIKIYKESETKNYPIVITPLANSLNQNVGMIVELVNLIDKQIEEDKKLFNDALNESIPEWLN